MAELDFSKIFGETATSKASFTEENYLSGWGYLGSTPPPYQLFDYLQSLNDQKSKYLYDRVNENDNNLTIHNTDVNAHTAILNAIKAISGASAYDISPSKTITAMIPLLGFGGIVAQRLEANGYVKFANGFIIQWGRENITNSGVVVFPISFTKSYQPLVLHLGSTVIPVSANPIGNTSMTIMDTASSQSATSWLAVGI